MKGKAGQSVGKVNHQAACNPWGISIGKRLQLIHGTKKMELHLYMDEAGGETRCQKHMHATRLTVPRVAWHD